jgi:hypothetical protein
MVAVAVVGIAAIVVMAAAGQLYSMALQNWLPQAEAEAQGMHTVQQMAAQAEVPQVAPAAQAAA